VDYTNLKGGNYHFVMRMADPMGHGSKEVKVRIVKEKAFYEQIWFHIIAALLLLLLIAAIVRLYILRKTKKYQQKEEENRILIREITTAFAKTIDMKDRYTNGHSIRVAAYAREIAKRMGMSADEQDNIYYIALLHDIGKIGIPDNILNKKGALTPEERAIIQTHPAVGGKVLADFTALEDIDDGARYHHERYDGKGYCDGLSGKEIPLVARIIGVADSYDAMASDRCYRPALSREKIIDELTANSGTKFDPDIVPHMLAMIQEGIVPAGDTELHL
jgi:energy-coupling factor transport system substrate-specific component